MECSIQWRKDFPSQLKRASALRILELLLVVAVPFALLGATNFTQNSYSYSSVNYINQENQRPGTTRWQSIELNKVRDQQIKLISNPLEVTSQLRTDADYGGSTIANETWTDTKIRGYASETSINHGDSIKLYVSTGQPSYNLEVYRMGWYQGTGARLMLTVSNLPGQNQLVPTPEANTGLIECNWQISYTLKTLSSWVSGVYLVKLIARDGSVGYIMFVLRNDAAAADILYQVPIATYQAYNNWGGKSLYDYNSTGGRAYKVSYDRPYDDYSGAGFFFLGDYNMIRWLELHNYNVTYVTSLDTQTNPRMYTNRKIFLSDWHDEYWSKEMRDNLTHALDQGEHLAFFGANNIYWQIRFESSTTGRANRVEVCYKNASLDPFSSSEPWLTTVNWRSAPVNKPENALLGVMYESQFTYGTSFPWIVTNSSHWIYNGTGLKTGETIPGLVGYEYDKIWNNGSTPAGLTLLSSSPIVDVNGVHSTANGAIYTAASNALVFTAGTIYWVWKLDDNSYQHRGADRNVQRMTSNVLNAMINRVLPHPAGTNGIPSFPFYDSRLNIVLAITGSILLIALFIVLGRVIVRRINNRIITSTSHIPASGLSAMEILYQRYARGEIDTTTFEQMRERLKASNTDTYSKDLH